MITSVDHIVAYLERLRQKPGMYIGSDITRLLPHLHGFRAGCAIHGFQQDTAIYAAVMQEHGWRPPAAMALCSYLIEQGHDYSFIVNEVLAIEIENGGAPTPNPIVQRRHQKSSYNDHTYEQSHWELLITAS